MPNRLVETGSRLRAFPSRAKMRPTRGGVNVQAKRCTLGRDPG
jgi:hypothetical protein